MVKGTTINGEVYLKTILRLKEALKLKRPSSWRQKNLLLSENCKVHKACNIQAVIQECGLTELRHLLFVQKTKKKTRGPKFTTDK
jgi:hypothetical protein